LREHRQRITDLQAATLTPDRESVVRDCLQAPRWEAADLSPVCVGTGGSPIGVLISARRAHLR
jgi:hypothetical protein